MSKRARISIEELREGFKQGRRLIQEEWANPSEIADTTLLVEEEGVAIIVQDWEFKGDFQCMVRKLQGIKQ